MRLVQPSVEHAEVVAGWSRSPEETSWWCSRQEHPVPGDVIRNWWAQPDVQAFLLLEDGAAVAYGEMWLDEPSDEVELMPTSA